MDEATGSDKQLEADTVMLTRLLENRRSHIAKLAIGGAEAERQLSSSLERDWIPYLLGLGRRPEQAEDYRQHPDEALVGVVRAGFTKAGQ